MNEYQRGYEAGLKDGMEKPCECKAEWLAPKIELDCYPYGG